ncbi:MAG: tetratricopeptide repeat protein [Deltaproteobacteria bacterium]|nr:tetratricopeptide repeat protein [Deltaproteobacteria bacterium]
MDQGHANLDFGTYAEAAPYLQRLIDLEPANTQRVIDMARFLAGQHNFHPKGQSRLKGNREAIKLLEKSLKTFTDDADIHAELARNLAQGGIDRCDEAIPHFRRAIEQHPSDGSLHSDIAVCAYGKQDYETAVKEFEIALTMLDPERDALALFRAREFLGKTYQALGQWKDAERELKSATTEYEKWVAINGNPNYWGCPFQSLGALYTKTDHRRASDDAYIKSADYQPLKWQTQINASIRAYQYGDYERAQQLTERALAANPDLPDVRVLRGFITLALRDTAEAERVFTWQNDEAWPPFSRRFDATYGARVGLAHLAIAEHREDDALELVEKLVSGPYTWQTRAWTWFEHRALSNIETYDPFEANELNRFFYHMACLAGAWANSNKREHEKALPYYE